MHSPDCYGLEHSDAAGLLNKHFPVPLVPSQLPGYKLFESMTHYHMNRLLSSELLLIQSTSN